jgi:hypothetical protein
VSRPPGRHGLHDRGRKAAATSASEARIPRSSSAGKLASSVGSRAVALVVARYGGTIADQPTMSPGSRVRIVTAPRSGTRSRNATRPRTMIERVLVTSPSCMNVAPASTSTRAIGVRDRSRGPGGRPSMIGTGRASPAQGLARLDSSDERSASWRPQLTVRARPPSSAPSVPIRPAAGPRTGTATSESRRDPGPSALPVTTAAEDASAVDTGGRPVSTL